MDESSVFTSVDFAFSASGAPWDDHEQFVHDITGTIRCIVDDTDEVAAGTITVLKVSAVEAINKGLALYELFDAHSQFLEAAYVAIFDGEGEAREELEIEPGWDDILILSDFEIRPEFRNRGVLVEAFEAAIAVFASQGIVVAAMESERHDFVGLDLTVEEWRRLGFIRIAGSQFVFRDNCKFNPYRDKLEDNASG